MHRFLSLSAVAVLAASALSQTLVPIPAHNNVYNGFSRGYTFTSNTNFIIQSLDLPPDAFQTGDTAGYMVRVNGVQTLLSIGNAGAITPGLLINPGDVVDVLGNWSPAVTGNFTAHNSYTVSATNFPTTIEGVPHTIQRSGWQWDIGDPALGGSFLNATTGQCGRVLMYTTPQNGLFANFTSNVQAGPVPTTVNFTDTTFTSAPSGVQAWAWDLDGDATIDSTLQNPSFTYGACGAYDVTLTANDGINPASTVTKTGFIQIGITPIAPSFTFAALAPGVYQFTDTSTPTPASWAWDLDGDGTTDSTLQNPVWAYVSPCISTNVTLAVSSTCAGPWTRSEVIVASPLAFTTTLAPNNGAGTGPTGGNLFNIDVTNPNGIGICALTLTPYATTLGNPLTCAVWLTDAPGGYVGNNTNAAVWRQVGTGNGTDNGSTTTPVVFALTDTVYVPFGTYGMAVTTSQGLRYRTEPSNPFVYTGPDFSISTGIGTSALFGTVANQPRGICATFHYSTFGMGDLAGYGYFGSGCAGSMGISRLSNDVAPALGSTINVTVDRLPVNAALMMTGFSKTNSPLGALPLSVAPFGAPGCFLRVSPDANLLILGTANAATWSLPIPVNAGLVGVLMFQQAVALDPGFNAAGAVASDAHGMMLGL